MKKLLSVLLKSAFTDMYEEKMKQVKYQSTEAQENVNVGKVPLFLLLMYLCARRASQIVGKSFKCHSSGKLLLNWNIPTGNHFTPS